MSDDKLNDKTMNEISTLLDSMRTIVKNYNKYKDIFTAFNNKVKELSDDNYYGIVFINSAKSDTELIFTFLGNKYRICFNITKFVITKEPQGKLTISMINVDSIDDKINIDDMHIAEVLFDESGRVDITKNVFFEIKYKSNIASMLQYLLYKHTVDNFIIKD